jgi:hypothetical protein
VNTALIEKETLLFGFLKSQAQQILSVYVREVLKVPRRSVAEHFVDVMVETVATFVFAKSDVSPWLAQALLQVPNTVLTDENKQVICDMASEGSGFRRGRLAQEFDILAKRARSSAVRAK